MLNDPRYFKIPPKQLHWLFKPYITSSAGEVGGPREKERELDDCWQERKFQKANTTPLIEIRNSAMWWLNYTHTHTHDDRYLLPFIRVMEKLGSIVQLEMKKEKKRALDCSALPYCPVFSIIIEPQIIFPLFHPTLLCKLLLPCIHTHTHTHTHTRGLYFDCG